MSSKQARRNAQEQANGLPRDTLRTLSDTGENVLDFKHSNFCISANSANHSCYSAQEHSAISSTSKAQSLAQQHAGSTLPVDIRVETMVATLAVCLGIVIGSEKLHPIRWQVWAGKIERVGKAGFLDGNGQVDRDFRGSPFRMLEYRPSFLDIRRQRLAFAKWVKARDTL
ncbi:Magnesium transporter, partial [Metarhizium brunneum ARSEF 3297]